MLDDDRREGVAFVLDITNRKRAEEEMRAARVAAEQARAAAESASRAKDQFIAVLSHELRTPLTPAVAALSLLQDDRRLPPDVREDLEMVRRNIDLEVRLIADLLDVSRVNSGKMHFERRSIDVAQAIRDAAAIVRSEVEAKRQVLSIETPGAPYMASGDAARLQQVFWNLLRNAIKFTPEGGSIAIRASAAPVDRCMPAGDPCPGGMGRGPRPPDGDGNEGRHDRIVTVEVADTGCGIDRGVLPRLFNAFEQAREARSFGGLGLGLAICKAVVEMHGGSIEARSDGPGRGAIFSVRLPLAERLPEETAARGPYLRSGRVDGPAGAPRLRILLVEDHPDTARLMQRLLASKGCEVAIADSVAAGVAAVDRAAPDIIISDLGLPDGSGLDLVRQLAEQGKDVPAIALSGFGTSADIEKSRAAGFSEHLVKPIEGIETLMDAVRRVAGSRGTGGLDARS